MTRIVILGGGESGTGAAILAKKNGYDVFLSDNGPIGKSYKALLNSYDITFEEKKHTEALVYNADEVVKSPGIPDHIPLIKKINALRIPIISEIELAVRHTQIPIIAITGTNGKTTTTLLIHHILTQAGLSAGLVGNIGESFAKQVAETKVDYWVLEISSFQLDDCHALKPYISIMLNITPDHLDRYNYDIDAYANSKFRITQNQTSEDYLIYNVCDALVLEKVGILQSEVHSIKIGKKIDAENIAYTQNGLLKANFNTTSFDFEAEKLPIKGPHNMMNALFAIEVALILGLNTEAIKEGLCTFKGAAHRMEFIRELDGIDFINDSKATNIDATYWALSSFEEKDIPLVWIVGGVDKGNDYAALDKVSKTVKHIIALGEDNTKILAHYKEQCPITEVQSMQEAVNVAISYADKGDTVLLCPACASFDLFKNYEDRGDQFRTIVQDF